jgi:MSHA biogenesis protein MshN
MSLINTMLKDLELHRRSQKPAREVPRYEQATLPVLEPRRWLSISALVQATLTVLVAGGVASWVARHAPMGQMMPLEPAGPVATASPPMASERVAHAPLPQPQPVRLEPVVPTPATPAMVEPPAAPMPPVVQVVPVVPTLHSSDKLAKAPPEPSPAAAAKKAPAIAAPVQAPAQNPIAQRPHEVKPTAQPSTPAPPPREMLAAQADKLYTQALEHQKQGQAEQAMASLQASLAANPKQVQARLLLASMLVQRKQAGPAADLLTDGLMLLPQQTAFMRELAPLWITAGQQEDAMALLAQGAKIAGNSDPGFHGYYASQLLRLKRTSEVQTHYRLALAGNPEQAEWLVGLGLALQQQDSAAEALEAFRRASASGKLSSQMQAMVNQVIAKLQAQNP